MSSAAARSKPFIRETREGDTLELAATMRQADRDEIWHASRVAPLESLEAGLRLSSSTHTVEWDGKVIAIFGVCGTLGHEVGVPWMLGTDDIQRCRKSLLRGCRAVVDGYANAFPYLTNACWSKNVVHINWIKWLGFTFEGSDLRNGETFLHFHRRTYV